MIYNADGPLVNGGFSISFSKPPVATGQNGQYGFSFLASWSGSGSDFTTIDFYSGNTLFDSLPLVGNGNPRCSTKTQCDAMGLSWIDPQDMAGFFGMLPTTVDSIVFHTTYVDDITFGATSKPPRRYAPGDPRRADAAGGGVPEPATMALLGLGLFGVLTLRRRR